MKPKFILYVFLFALAGCASGNWTPIQSQETRIQKEVQSAFAKLSTAAQTLNHEDYFSLFDERRFSILNADGSIVTSFEAFKSAYLPQMRSIQRYNNLNFDPVNIQVIDSHNAILVNAYTAEIVLQSGETVSASGAGAQFWSKQSGEWKLVHVTNAIKP